MTALNGSADTDNKLSKRVSHLFAVGAVPAALISTVGDLFGQKGGWLVVGLLGVGALILCAYLLFSLSINDEKSPPIWFRLTSGDKELNWIWNSKPPLLSHGVHVVALFGVICLFSAGKTYAALDAGGYIGKNVEAVAAAQVQLGLAILAEQKKTNDSLGTLVATAGTLKRETSDDPRKELQNLGRNWDISDFDKSIWQNDERAIAEYIKGGFPVGSFTPLAAEKALNAGNPTIQNALAKYLTPLDPEGCQKVFFARPLSLALPPTASSKALLKAVCDQPVVVAVVKQKIKDAQRSYDKEVADKKEWDGRSASERRKNEEKVRKCQDEAGVGVLFGNVNCGAGTEDPGIPSDDKLRRWKNIAEWLA